jgi:hypothetical protein
MSHPTDLNLVGTSVLHTWACPCGGTFSYELLRVVSPVNSALATSVQSWEDFHRARVWFPEHHDHGKPVQL